jgi:hypothetical protein
MSTTLDEQIKQLKQTIAEMEAQRSVLGDAVVEAALTPLRQKLSELEAQAKLSEEEPAEIPTRQRKLVTYTFGVFDPTDNSFLRNIFVFFTV